MAVTNLLSSPVKIIDTTLREGMQAPGVQFSAEQSVEIALLLAELGVETIECGHPSISKNEQARILSVRDALKSKSETNLLCHARANARDIEAVASLGVDWIGIFMGLNQISLSTRLSGWNRDKALLCIEKSVSLATTAGLKVRFTIEDASRTSLNEAIEAYKIALKAGANRICFADTVGLLVPVQTTKWIADLQAELPSIPIEVHFHDDRGLSMANALAAIEAGASWIATSVNGLGERCGIVDLMALLANLEYMGIRKIPNPDLLQDLSRRVAAYSRSFIDYRRPVTGRNAFVHTSKLHQRAQSDDHRAYEWLAPERVGRIHIMSDRPLSCNIDTLVTPAVAILASELKYHQNDSSVCWIMIGERLVHDCRQFCIVQRISYFKNYGTRYVDPHIHDCDSLYVFIGEDEALRGLRVEVEVNLEKRIIESPSSMFIPAGHKHSYRVISGQGFFIKHLFSGSYNASLLETI